MRYAQRSRSRFAATGVKRIPTGLGLCVVALAVAGLTGPRVAFGAAAANLAIKATATSFRAGTNGMYRITVTNLDSTNADDRVHVTATLPNGLGFASGSAPWTCTTSARFFDCSLSGLAGATTQTLELVVGVGTAAVPSVSTTFELGYSNDPNLLNNSVTRTTSVKPGSDLPTATPTPTGSASPTPATPTPGPPTPTPTPVVTDLLLTMVTVGPFVIGSQGTYFLAATNIGIGTTNEPLVIADTLPLGLTFVSNTGDGWTCTAAGQNVTCTFAPALTAASSTGLTLMVQVGRDAYPSVTNIATLVYAGDSDLSDNVARRPTSVRRPRFPLAPTPTTTAGGGTPVPTRTATTTPTVQPVPTATPRNALATDLQLIKTSAGGFRVGRSATYVLTVRNLGPRATNAPVTVVDTLPITLPFRSAVGSGWTCAAASQVVTCVHADGIPAFGTSAVSLDVLVSRAAFPSVTNEASVHYAGDTDASNNVARRPTTVRQ